MFVCTKVNMLYEIGAIEKVSELDRFKVEWTVYVNIEVISNDEVMRGGGGPGKKRWEWIKKCEE